MKTIVTTFMLLIAATILVSAQATKATGTEAEIVRLENDYDRADAKNDVATLNRLLADDFTATYFVPPKLMSKAEYLADLKSLPFPVELSSPDDLKVRVHGDTAIATGRWKQSRKNKDGKLMTASGRFTDVWVKIAGQWKLEASHASPDGQLK